MGESSSLARIIGTKKTDAIGINVDFTPKFLIQTQQQALKMYTDIEDPESWEQEKKQGLVQTHKLRLSGIGEGHEQRGGASPV